MFNLKNREKLLADLASGLRMVAGSKITGVRVRLLHKGAVIKEYLGFDLALDEVVNDVYWDAEGNWSEADGVAVDTY
jgi:hypothetical protein